ncbi:hypothetical protein ACQ4LE_000964 [Meloidogyne hapla]
MKRHIIDIFVIAHKYHVEMLQYQCESFMSSILDANNVVKYCSIISLYGAPTLEKAIGNYIKIKGKKYLKSKEWEEIESLYPQLAVKFLKCFIDGKGKKMIK